MVIHFITNKSLNTKTNKQNRSYYPCRMSLFTKWTMMTCLSPSFLWPSAGKGNRGRPVDHAAVPSIPLQPSESRRRCPKLAGDHRRFLSASSAKGIQFGHQYIITILSANDTHTHTHTLRAGSLSHVDTVNSQAADGPWVPQNFSSQSTPAPPQHGQTTSAKSTIGQPHIVQRSFWKGPV